VYNIIFSKCSERMVVSYMKMLGKVQCMSDTEKMNLDFP